jgi:transcriptional regulator with XRE-family HTH domain
MKKGHAIDRRASLAARTFGSLIRSRRQALAMSQDQLALATGVGRRFLIELEAGKASCHLGRSLVVAQALGLHSALQPDDASPPIPALDLPDIPGDAND